MASFLLSRPNHKMKFLDNLETYLASMSENDFMVELDRQ